MNAEVKFLFVKNPKLSKVLSLKPGPSECFAYCQEYLPLYFWFTHLHFFQMHFKHKIDVLHEQ